MAELSNLERSFDEIKNKTRVSTPNPWLDPKFNRIDPWGKEPGIRVDDIPERLGLIQQGQKLDLLGNDFIDLGDTPSNYGKSEQFVKTDGDGKLTFDWPYWIKAGSTIYYKKGNVGVGISGPTVRFHTYGDNILDGAVTINESGRDKDFRVEGDTEINLLFCDASTDRVAIGLNVPLCRTHIRGVVCADYTGLHPDVYLMIENDDSSYIQLQGSTVGNAGFIFADDDYNPPAGLIRYDFANEQIEFGIGTNELVYFKSNHAVFSYGYIHLDSPNTYAVFVADSHNADSYVEYKEDGSTKWTAGFDYTDSFKYQISEGVPGTNVRFEIEPGASGLINCYQNIAVRNTKGILLYDNGNYVGFRAPALTGDQIWVLPSADGPANEALGTDGGGTLIWRTHDGLAGFVSSEHLPALDEDNMVSDSDTNVATQQSIKAYADNEKASKTTAAWSKSIGSGGDYADWATMIAAMPDLIAHAVTVTIETGTTLTEICSLLNKQGLTTAAQITIVAEKYFPTSGTIPTADSATATTLRDAALATAALGDDYFNGCWIFIVDVGTNNITGVTVGGAGAGEFKVAGDLTARYLAADVLIVKGSTNNDGIYTISAGGSTHAGGTTTIPVDEAVAAVADGTVQTQGVLENGFVPITDYVDATGDVVVANWSAAQPIAGDRYLIVGALIDGEGTRKKVLAIRKNMATVNITGIGITNTDGYGLDYVYCSNLIVSYCGFYNADTSGLYLATSLYCFLQYCGIVGNNTNNLATHGGCRIEGINSCIIRYCAFSDNNQRGILGRVGGMIVAKDTFGDGNGAWGVYADRSSQIACDGTECSGSNGDHSDEGTADAAGDDQASAYDV